MAYVDTAYWADFVSCSDATEIEWFSSSHLSPARDIMGDCLLMSPKLINSGESALRVAPWQATGEQF
jgi:hypothetical protein